MTADAGPVVVGLDLSKSYGDDEARTMALDHVSVEIPAGSLTCITGPSGSGKTTLLHTLAGLTTPDSGTVTVAGHDLAGLDETGRADLRRDLMGFVFQRLNLLPALTVAENVAVPMLLRGLRRDEVRARTGEVLALVGLAGRGDSAPAALSGGEAQRVAVARAISTRPAVIWTDEPTGALDSAAAAGVLDLLRELVAAGSTVVVVSHDPDVASRADLEVRLRDGRRDMTGQQ
jgi:putative ABC transport system ATP-binding protein